MMASQSFEENEDSNSVYTVYEDLKTLCLSNAEYFKSDESLVGKKLSQSFQSLHNNVVSIYPLVDEIRKAAPHYDFNQNTPGNGYRSYVTVVDAFILFGQKTCQQVSKNRSSYFFRKSTYLKEVDTCSQALSSLSIILSHLKTLISWSDPGCLFPNSERTPQELLANTSDEFNQICFYGSCLGFQFCESMQVILKGLSILMVSFSEVYYSEGGMLERATNYLWHTSKYVLNPELRARRIVHISQYASVDFCKEFWFLGENELMNRLPNFVHPAVEVNRMISLPPEPLSSPRADGSLVEIPVPSAHTGTSALNVRLLSAVKRQHMVGEASTAGKECTVAPSRGLIFHCHGGGFVAQSSRSHEAYLRQWAQGLPCPILSVDYSLAPEAPFPRALEDALYAYCWALNNTTLLGTTAERIVFAGDSAGANLVIGVTMKCIELGLRPPDGLFLAYVPVLVSTAPSPGRLICLMDPLLPFGFLMGCLKAYACPPEVYAASKAHDDKLRRNKKPKEAQSNIIKSSSEESFEEISASELLELDKLLEQESRGSGGPVLKDEPQLFEPQDAVSPGLPNRITRTAGNIATAITGTISSLAARSRFPSMDVTDSAVEDDPLLQTMHLPCPMDMLNFEVPQDPYMSPYLASDSSWNDNGSCFSAVENDPLLKTMQLPCLMDMLNFDVPQDPYLSPYLASDPSWNDNGSCFSTVEDDPLLMTMHLPCPMDMLNFGEPQDPYMSPYLASDSSCNDNGSCFSAVEDDPLLKTMHLPCLMDMLNFDVPQDPYMSPYLASDSSWNDNGSCFSAVEDDPLLKTMHLPCPMDMLNFDVPQDPYMSPYLASDSTLIQFPPVHICTLQMDPCLDDCVEFAKKLKRLGNPITLDIFEGLPHGFLNFVMLSKEAYEASKKCIQKLSDLLALDSNSNS